MCLHALRPRVEEPRELRLARDLEVELRAVLADDFDDDAMWDALDEAQATAPKPASQPPKPPAHDDFDDDEDMWDAVREAEGQAASKPAGNKPDSVDRRRRAEEEEMESMYA